MPVQKPNDLDGEEGSKVRQDNSGSGIAENPIKKFHIGNQVDILA